MIGAMAIVAARRARLRKWLRLALAIALAAPLFACRDPYAQIEQDRKRFPALSLARPVGSACFAGDSASVARGRHPLGPTGGWSRTAEVDYARTLRRPDPPGQTGDATMYALVAHGQVIAGYVRTATEGTLQVRTYDDVYGSVYGGWSPVRLDIRPTPRPVFVALGRSAYGDGGSSQVHEVCWTSKGDTQGVILYSSAYPAAGPALRARDVFRDEDLGAHGAYYNSGLALRMLAEILQDRDLHAAEAFLDRAAALLDSLPAAVDGASGAAIPSRVFRSREWADLLAFRLGLAVGRPSFEGVAGEFETVVKSRDAGRFCFDCDRYERLLPLYRWVHARTRTPGAALPDPSTLQRGVGGYDPVAIAGLLGGEPERRHQTPTVRFWSGVRACAAGDRSGAETDLAGWLAQPAPATASGFELAAAARLLDGLQASGHRD
jgi:hypothetical protein